MIKPLMMCEAILHMGFRIYSLTSTPIDRWDFLEALLFYLLLEFLPEICWEDAAEEIFFSYFVLLQMFELASRLVGQDSTYYITPICGIRTYEVQRKTRTEKSPWLSC